MRRYVKDLTQQSPDETECSHNAISSLSVIFTPDNQVVAENPLS